MKGAVALMLRHPLQAVHPWLLTERQAKQPEPVLDSELEALLPF